MWNRTSSDRTLTDKIRFGNDAKFFVILNSLRSNVVSVIYTTEHVDVKYIAMCTVECSNVQFSAQCYNLTPPHAGRCTIVLCCTIVIVLYDKGTAKCEVVVFIYKGGVRVAFLCRVG